MILVGGAVEAYLARDADGGAIEADAEIVVVERTGPRSVLVTRLYDDGQAARQGGSSTWI